MTAELTEFMDHLKQNDLIIVSRNDYENGVNIEAAKKQAIQNKLLNKPALTLYQVVQNKLTHYTSIRGLAASKDFKPGEMYLNKKGVRMVVTSAILRIRNNKHL